ncbi:hypothetical protein BASA81_000962 [Batrachochytrium salamandrivorans]|nr:hypothetical protein BASA81_000962 [Batrachochytrium salamandrivorans]
MDSSEEGEESPPAAVYKVSSAEEYVFQIMAYRKLERQLRGTYKTDKPWTLFWTFMILLLLFGLVAPNFVKDEANSHRSFDISINLRNVGFWSFLAVVFTVLLVFALTRVVVVVRWSLYWLLAALSILYLWSGSINLFSEDTPLPLIITFAVLEFSTFALYISQQIIYPKFARSNFFRENIGVVWWFGLRPVFKQKFTLTYDSDTFGLQGRRSCTYRGELDADGLPHGFGNWLDDSYHGELMSGVWDRGEPVGPFRSREFGSGFAFESLRVGFVHCSDDTTESRNWFPSQERLPTIGAASVECSVAGGFFSHLPRATILDGPYCLASLFYSSAEQETNPFDGGEEDVASNPFFHTNPHRPMRRVQDVLPQLKVLFSEHPSSSLIITATKDRGVLVSGHTLENQLLRPNRLVIDIVQGDSLVVEQDLPFADHEEEGEELFYTPLLSSPALDSVPLFFDLSRIPSATLHNQVLQQQDYEERHPYSRLLQGTRSFMLARSSFSFNSNNNVQSAKARQSVRNRIFALSPPPLLPPMQPVAAGPYLKVQNWKSTVEGHVEALVLFPGFNASLEHSLQRLGQFMAMGRFPPHIKPFVFSWPCARELTYMHACKFAKSHKTHFALESFLRGLHSAGVRDIHFLAHSAGAQVVASGFTANAGGEAADRTPLSKLFAENNQSSYSLLRLRTVTFLNPDTPLSQFIHQDFRAIRRVCDHITIVGDSKDGALYWSEMANGVALTIQFLRRWFRCGCVPRTRRSCNVCCRVYAQGCCRPHRHGTDRPFSSQLAVGKNIFSLYLRDDRPLLDDQDDEDVQDEPEDDDDDEEQAFTRRSQKRWLDVDVIDTSSMETNVHQLRHAYFDLNKILVEDLHELIVTGKRAAERSLLLHREGNIFSFCQAPACVVNE